MTKQWFILVVKTRNEIKVAEQLAAGGFTVYCPTKKEVKLWSDRKKTVTTPLFSSYVFVQLKDKERSNVFTVPGIVRYLFWLGKPAVVQDAEMYTLQKWLANDAVDQVSLAQFHPGENITIKHGVLKDKKAVIQQVNGKRVKLAIQGLGIVVNIKLRELVN
ncbi:UpxY family transcription antiterminator [Flavobacterium sp. ASW18X]|uniref:UpxY family transcription antiterminator n=1 Tax=Flavobacterium sp. ASW18X TaxID=2572595 RepID=UPI0010AEA077|nr:UpxY family transcription antiterminator [Flavobacterium sp. ASW18X]TKD65557.1 UpxY family transcription antiterminator [Flavobacterium sp. ASW18X]